MKRNLIICLATGLTGLIFLGATGRSSGYLDWQIIRPHPVQNNEMPAQAGYLVVSCSGGEYVVDRRDIVGLSCHTYYTSSGMQVWEVTASDRSSNTVRWYLTQAVTTPVLRSGSPSDEGTGGKLDPLDKKSSAGDAFVPPPPYTKLELPITKDYPEATHSHSIEFRVSRKNELDDIYAYLCLMVYGWSPQQERPREARNIRVHQTPGAWNDWTK